MKKTFHALTAAVFALGLCNCDSKQPAGANSASENSMNPEASADWAGTYTGLIPSASGSGTNLTITLRGDFTYEALHQYIGRQDGDFTSAGTFKWDKDTGVITLEGTTSAPSLYQVGENKLTQLDMEGKPITGPLADDYVLKKQ